MKTKCFFLSVLMLLSLLSISGLVLAQGTSTDQPLKGTIAPNFNPLVSYFADPLIVDMAPNNTSESQSRQPNYDWLDTAVRAKPSATPPPPPPTLLDKLAPGRHLPTVVLVD